MSDHRRSRPALVYSPHWLTPKAAAHLRTVSGLAGCVQCPCCRPPPDSYPCDRANLPRPRPACFPAVQLQLPVGDVRGGAGCSSWWWPRPAPSGGGCVPTRHSVIPPVQSEALWHRRQSRQWKKFVRTGFFQPLHTEQPHTPGVRRLKGCAVWSPPVQGAQGCSSSPVE